jgi:hypothetical protein
MKLSKKKAIELCIALWTWLAETGKQKRDWPEWEKYEMVTVSNCWFCEYDYYFGDACMKCPLRPKYKGCGDTYFVQWNQAKTPRTRKKYAKLFLDEIKKC